MSDFQQNGNVSVEGGAPKNHKILHIIWIDTKRDSLDREIDRTTQKCFSLLWFQIAQFFPEGYRHNTLGKRGRPKEWEKNGKNACVRIVRLTGELLLTSNHLFKKLYRIDKIYIWSVDIVCLGSKKLKKRKNFVCDGAFKTNAIQARWSFLQIRNHRRDMVFLLSYSSYDVHFLLNSKLWIFILFLQNHKINFIRERYTLTLHPARKKVLTSKVAPHSQTLFWK